jgi:uncharacterized protein (DUF433 family)
MCARLKACGRDFIMTYDDRIILDSEILVGKPVIKGTRLAVEFIIELLANGWSHDDILKNYPGLTHEDILACLGPKASL